MAASSGQGNHEIQRNLSISVNTVRKWRDRWFSKQTSLLVFESGVNEKLPSNSNLLAYMLSILSDEQRSGKPATLNDSQKQALVAMACETPDDYDIPVTTWTHQLLAETLVKEDIVTRISPTYVGVILKKSGVTSR